MEELVLREGGAPDIADVMAIMNDAFPPDFGEAWTQAQCLGVLDLPRVWVTIARFGARPAGFALSRVVVDEAELLLLAVRPECRRKRVGAELVRHTKTVARASGARLLHLEVRDGNSAQSMYNRAGFAEVGRRRAYYRGVGGQLFDALSLSVRLVPDERADDQT
jgi:ribosomal-protein-alanine N-acetyltransferase